VPISVLYYLSFFLNMIFYPLILLVGLILCKKHKFRGGYYFFLILLINQIYSFVYPLIILNLIDSRMDYQKDVYYTIHISQICSIIEIIIQICAFLILLVSLYKMLTSRDIVSQLLEKIKNKMLNHKKITIILISILFFIITIILLIGSSKDFELISAKVQITKNPSTAIVSVEKEGEEPNLPDQYIEYTVVIKNKKNKQYGDPHNFVQLDFIPSKEIVLLFGKEVFSDRRGYSGPGFFEANQTREFTIVYGISDHVNSDIKSLEEQALDGQFILSLNRKRIARLSLR
jgi:hypothetical protein